MVRQLYNDDCLTILPTLDPVDAVVTDPPYGMGFMGKDWDHGVPGKKYWEAILQAAKPGVMLLAFGGTRTHHRLMCGIEDAGWQIRDTLMWVYGSGFPKSHDISKAIDKAAGVEREVVETRRQRANSDSSQIPMNASAGSVKNITAPATNEAKKWQGRGTALKPAWEPIILAMKPLDGTFADNALTHGVAGLNIDGCRIGTAEEIGRKNKRGPYMCDRTWNASSTPGHDARGYNRGRWPSNLIHDGSDEVIAGFPETPGGDGRPIVGGGIGNNGVFGKYKAGAVCSSYADSGSASRFFYCAKASKEERGTFNEHPTVKPIKLMEYLCKLVTPPGGVVLDPFVGSGSTLLACINLGFGYVGIDKDWDSYETARNRILEWQTK